MAKIVRGANELAARIRRIRKSTEVFINTNQAGALILRRNKERFQNEVDPDGRPWLSLDQETVKRKRRGGFKRKILQRTGRLARSIGIIRGGGLFGVATGVGSRIGINDPAASKYGPYHQRGQGVPQRKFLGVSASDVQAVDVLLRRAIIRASGLR